MGFHMAKGTLYLAGKGKTIERIGITDPLTIKYHRGIEFTHTFEIMDMETDTDIYLSSDILPKLGIYLQGVAHKWDDEDESSNKDKNTSDPDLPTPDESPYGTTEDRGKFWQIIKPSIEANESIPINSACTLPESVVRLDTPEGKYSYC